MKPQNKNREKRYFAWRGAPLVLSGRCALWGASKLA